VGNNPLSAVDATGHSPGVFTLIGESSIMDAAVKEYQQQVHSDQNNANGQNRAQQQNQNLSPTDKVALKAEQAALGPTRESVAAKNSHEYGGLIVKNKKSGKISSTVPLRGNGISIDVDSIPVPAGTTVIATYHSHPHSSAVEDAGPSQSDVDNSAAHNNRPGYVLDSFGGRVYRYDGHTDARPFPAGTYIGTVQ
jgi:proteasome lid subunit RPN8/RPN11